MALRKAAGYFDKLKEMEKGNKYREKFTVLKR
jgi:hypothetical protein